MGEIKFVGALVLTALFAIAIISYVSNFGTDNDVAVDFNDDPDLQNTATGLQSDLDTYRLNVNSSSTSFSQSEITIASEVTRTGGVFKGGGVFQTIGTVKRILNSGWKKIFGNEQGNAGFGIVLTALISFLVFVAVRYVYKSWVGKNPD
ncbi:hypothetical protein CMI37_21810 [Candidatus Pacearchaeota archaeon]|nr:hypothetical protein [Candidatus Pacearchaeota archaeon]|tara:strand:- start:1161 stop:1607 length:447 start_codon:yes stop_codon:yes gene_type:complete